MTLAMANFPAGLYGVRLAYQTSALRISKRSHSKSAFWDGFICFLSNSFSHTLSFTANANRSFFWLDKRRGQQRFAAWHFNSPQPSRPLNPAPDTSRYLKQPPTIFFETSLKK
jgi:hypothetical protein